MGIEKTRVSKKAGMNEIISGAVSYLMAQHAPKPLSQGGLAKLSGVSQGTICMNLKGERGWSIDILEKLCPTLGVPLEDLILIGKELQKGGRVFPWPGMLRNTPPASDERLRLIIRAAAGESTHLARLVNPQSVEETSPDEYAAYRRGDFSDGDMFYVVRKSLGYVESDVKFISGADEESVEMFYGK